MSGSRAGVVIGLGLVVLAAQAGAVELNYRWNKGDVHRFHYEDTSRFEMQAGGMGMGMGATVKTVTDFDMRVLRRLPGGKADVELIVRKLDLYQGPARLPALKKIPPAARKVLATVDRKGRATFHKMVTVYIKDEQVYLGIRKAQLGPTGAATSVSAGGPEGGVDVDLVASIDPKTGKIVASAKVRERPPRLRKVKIKQADPGVDILPKRLFEMMVLPEGQMKPGSRVEVTTPMAKMSVLLDALDAGVAKLHFSTDTRAAVPLSEPDNSTDEMDDGMGDGMGDDMNDGMGDDMQPPGMPDMGAAMGGLAGMDRVPGMPGASGGASADMGARTDARLRFDTARGRLLRLTGTLSVDMSVGGMGKMSTTSQFELERR